MSSKTESYVRQSLFVVDFTTLYTYKSKSCISKKMVHNEVQQSVWIIGVSSLFHPFPPNNLNNNHGGRSNFSTPFGLIDLFWQSNTGSISLKPETIFLTNLLFTAWIVFFVCIVNGLGLDYSVIKTRVYFRVILVSYFRPERVTSQWTHAGRRR